MHTVGIHCAGHVTQRQTLLGCGRVERGVSLAIAKETANHQESGETVYALLADAPEC